MTLVGMVMTARSMGGVGGGGMTDVITKTVTCESYETSTTWEVVLVTLNVMIGMMAKT